MSILQKLRTVLGFSQEGEDTSSTNPPTSGDAADDGKTPVDIVTLDEAYAAYQGGARFIDVREPTEWDNGHVAGAVHHPVGTLENQPEIAVARDKPVVTYCAAGARAARAAAALVANGYSDVSALQGGYGDWAAAGYPVERPDDDTAS
ncbi:Rhodanese domain-containing protein [Salinisphaera dokdonensis CL-ES53]|uniref:Rhodanese domain-containing protein n=1 Tax=Salinisphaera dokdonensis CL-ES53 TaxID=1304272 RepID=A0ABV2B609_9GAMM